MHDSSHAQPTAPTPAAPTQQALTLVCQRCGYNLTGICTPSRPRGACPECGAAFDHAKLLERAAKRAAWLAHRPALAKSVAAPPLVAAAGVFIGMFIEPRATWALFLHVTAAGFFWNASNGRRFVLYSEHLANRRSPGVVTLLDAAGVRLILGCCQMVLTCVMAVISYMLFTVLTNVF